MKKHTRLLPWILALVLFSLGSWACNPGTANPDGKITDPKDGGSQSAAPKITITSPKRATMLTEKVGVVIEGSVGVPGSQIVEFSVNGAPVKVAADGSFSTKMDAKWGVNFITAKVQDKNGQEDYIGQSFIWSRTYQALNGNRDAKAAIARITEKGIDDEDRSSLNDLASILEHVLNGVDVDPLLPKVLTEGEYKIPPIGPKVKYTVTKEGKLKLGRRQVTIKPRKDGLSVWIKLKDFSIPVKGSAGKWLNKKADILAPEVSVEADVDLRFANDRVIVDVVKFNVDASKLEVKAFTGLFKFLNKTLTNRIRNTLQTQLETLVKTFLPGPVESFLRSFKLAKSFALPAVLGSKVISFDSGLDALVFDPNGGTFSLSVAISSEQGITDTLLGVPVTRQSPPKWADKGYALGAALSFNLLNQVLVAAWQTGALKQDISSLLTDVKLPIPAKNLKVQLEALLPPIIHPSGKASSADVGVGDVKVTAQFEQAGGSEVSVVAYVSGKFSAKLKLTPQNELSVDIAADPKELVVDIDSIQGLGDLSTGEVNGLIRSFTPKITELLASGILNNIPIPSIDLSTLAGQWGIPKGTILSIQNGVFAMQGDYLQITGDL